MSAISIGMEHAAFPAAQLSYRPRYAGLHAHAMQIVSWPHNDFKVEFLARGGEVWARQTTAG